MTGGPERVINGLELSPFVVLIGLLSALVVAFLLLTERLRIPAAEASEQVGGLRTTATSPIGVTSWPLAVVWIGFAVSGATNLVWMVLIAILIGGLFAAAITRLRAVHSVRGDTDISGPSIAVVSLLLVLLEFQWLFSVRIAVVTDPSAPLITAFSPDSLRAGVTSIVVPAAGLAILWWLLGHPERVDRARRLALSRVPPRVRAYLAPGAVIALFFLPLIPSPGGHFGLTFLGLATYEYGKIAYMWVLAGMVARYAVMGAVGDARARWYQDPRINRPAILFLLVAAGSVVRKDIGPLIPTFIGTLGMSWCALRDEATRRAAALGGTSKARDRAAASQARRVFGRDLVGPGVVIAIFGVATVLLLPYTQIRVEAYQYTWEYNWNASCDPPTPDMAAPPGPSGYTVCLRNLRSAEASERSQVAKSVAAVADGGLWGRGLRDTASGVVPLQETDFIIAAIWSKLGGLVVLTLGMLIVLLALAMNRAVWCLRAASGSALPPPADPPRLFAAGISVMILGQFLFVLLASLNQVPHSGLTAPLLSRGGQSTLALAAGVVLTLAAGYASNSPTRAGGHRSGGASPRQPGQGGFVLTASVIALALVLITLRPYGGYPEHVPPCSEKDPLSDPRKCSTDLIAYKRTRFEVELPDGTRYTRSPLDPWKKAAGNGPEPDQLGGLLTTRGGQGLADAALGTVLGGTRGSSLVDRLSPHSAEAPADGLAKLTIDPSIQIATSDALAADPTAKDDPPLAGGAVVLDARSGQVLAAASAPRPVQPVRPAQPAGKAEEGDPDKSHSPDPAVERFEDGSQYGHLDRDGVAAPVAGQCEIQTHIRDNDPACYRWHLIKSPLADEKAQRDEDSRYVDDLTDKKHLPRADDNRAIRKTYGPGSTFKVVIAAAYLSTPGTTPDDQIAAPEEVDFANNTIRNFNKGACPGSTDGSITLRQALAVSCNTAFVKLAQKIGWDRVRDMAVNLGFHVIGRPDVRVPAPLTASEFAGIPLVPEQAFGAAIGNDALGGGDVQSTPLQDAAMMATIANGGLAVQPSLVSEVRHPGSADTTPVIGDRKRAFTQVEADALKDALKDVTSAEHSGTASKLSVPGGRQLWAKTGTQEVVPEKAPTPPGAFVREIAWITGFFDTRSGPVSFAVALETKDEVAGGVRAREVARKVIAKIMEVRG
ncbi:MAG: FtsW/RodA/SpoVE family cell cycle protein [Pseudonocardia sp.]|nr:FtsW/RodA/SpoVE family cell cycle protein [Pseudonocardia sp.]